MLALDFSLLYLRICSCLACVYLVMDARGKFGEHERCVRVARGAAESNSSFLSALQTSQVTDIFRHRPICGHLIPRTFQRIIQGLFLAKHLHRF